MLTPPEGETIDVLPREFHRPDGTLKRRESRKEVSKRREAEAKAEFARIKEIEYRQERTFDAYAFVMGFEDGGK